MKIAFIYLLLVGWIGIALAQETSQIATTEGTQTAAATTDATTVVATTDTAETTATPVATTTTVAATTTSSSATSATASTTDTGDCLEADSFSTHDYFPNKLDFSKLGEWILCRKTEGESLLNSNNRCKRSIQCDICQHL